MSDAKTNHYTKKSIHVKLTLAQQAQFKKRLADYGLQMREVLLTCIEKICNPDDEYMQELLNECVENRLLPRDHITLDGDVENLYKLIGESRSNRRKDIGSEED
jgi:hypothetical protein